MNPVVSPRFTLNSADMEKFAHNALVFFAPVGLVALLALAKQIPTDWSYGSIVLYAINLLVDLLQKWIGQNTYQKVN